MGKDRVLIKNLVSLFGSQAINFLIPLITYPYLIRIIGLSNFGRVQFVLTIVLLLGMITDFGYNYTAPRDVAQHQYDRGKLSGIVSNVLSFKLTIFTILAFLLIIFSLSFSSLSMKLIWGGILFLLNLTLTPSWFFQGVERMEFIAFVDIFSKILFTASVFVIIRQPYDFVWVLPLWGMGGIVSAAVGLYLIFKKYKIKYQYPKISILLQELKTGLSPFMTNLATYTVTSSPILLLGIFHSSNVVGVYAIAEKLIRIPWILGGLFAQGIYPRVCKLYLEGMSSVQTFYRQVLPPFYLVQFIVLTGLFIGAYPIISYFTSEYVEETVITLRLLSVSVMFVVANVPFQTLILAQHRDKHVMRLFTWTAGINLVLVSCLSYLFSYRGAAIGSGITMFFLFVSLWYSTFNRAEKMVKNE